jgi:hypothetical protein
MRAIVPFVASALYIAAVFVGVFVVDPSWVPWVLAILSVAFLWCYVAIVHGRVITALLIVFLVTLGFPVSVLLAIGLPVYHSWSTMVASYMSSLREYGLLGGFELLVPLGAALLAAAFVRLAPSAP